MSFVSILPTCEFLMVAADCTRVSGHLFLSCFGCRGCRQDKFHVGHDTTVPIEFKMEKAALMTVKSFLQMLSVPAKSDHGAQNKTSERHSAKDCTSE